MELEDEEVYRFDGSDDLYDEEGNQLVKICKICGKRFSSGKALGGHIRIHFAQPKLLDPPKNVVFINQKKKKKLIILMKDDCDGEKIKKPKNNECLCCHKSFDSQKALYGHMRSHPEREYRGVVPPPLSSSSPPIHQNNSSSNSSTLSQDEVLKKMDDDDLIKVFDDDDDDDLVSDTPLRWLCTGKRGRKTTLVSTNSSGFCSSVSSSEDEDERMNAALVLMSLRNAGKYYDGENVDDDVRKTKKQRQIKKLGDLDEAAPSNRDDRYKCSTCNKSFSSHQALGGHRSSHRKPVVVISESKAIELKVEAAEVEGEHEDDIGSHQCELCGKIFETGQALGGHKRCHRTTTYTDDAPLVVQAAPLVESTQQQQQAVAAPDTARAMFNFDLNEPAFADDEHM